MRKNPGDNAFEKIQNLLRAEGYSWMADEMTMDLLAERNQLLIEPYIEKGSCHDYTQVSYSAISVK